MTPPSAMASRTTQTNAGPDPHTAVTASKCCAGGGHIKPVNTFCLSLGRTNQRGGAHLFVHEAAPSDGGKESHEDVSLDWSFRVLRVEGRDDDHALSDL